MSGYSKVPEFVLEQIERCPTDTFYVGKSREYRRSSVAEGALQHLGITWTDDELLLPSTSVVPPADQGRWSKRNIEGWIKVRKDLPKYEKTVGVWSTPNFGDPAKGYHTYSSTRNVYHREIWWGQQLAIRVEPQQPTEDSVRIGFIVDRVFDRTDYRERDLWMACSLLRENTNAEAGILSAQMPVSDWLKSQHVNWELLPVGQGQPHPFSEIASRLNTDPDTQRMKRMAERYDTVYAWQPTDVIVGDGEFSRYIGFKFRDNLVALECLDYGNALYLMYEDWITLSQRSRVDLLADTTADFDRIIHSAGWETRLASVLRAQGLEPRDS